MIMSKKLICVLGGMISAILLIVTARVIFMKVNHAHYHANFALYVNGAQDKFDNFTFYEEVASCSLDMGNDPHHRAHMHQQNNHVIHVHDKAVTWGDFFSNLSYGLSNKAVTTDAGAFASGETNKVTFVLNGQAVDGVAGRVIGDKDALLISYGSEDKTELQKRYDAIIKDAKQVDEAKDPAACAGAKPPALTSRLKRALHFWN